MRVKYQFKHFSYKNLHIQKCEKMLHILQYLVHTYALVFM